MFVYETQQPITAVLKLVAGNTRLVATDRAEVTVEVAPHNPGSSADVKAAEETTVDFGNGKLTVKAPKPHRLWGRTGSVDVTVELPAGSAVAAESAAGDVTANGELGRCRFKTATGDFHLEHTGELEIDSPCGDVVVERIEGNASVSTGGEVRITTIDGTARIKNLTGNTWVGACVGEANFNTASGDIVVAKAEQSITARTAAGNVRLLDVVRGTVSMQAATGELEVGIRTGTSAYLDVNTLVGSVRTPMSTQDAPETGETVRVTAHTFAGDIIVNRV